MKQRIATDEPNNDSVRAMPSARAATPTGLSRFASSCKHRITIARNDEHELRSVMAWRKREHPEWSQFAESYEAA